MTARPRFVPLQVSIERDRPSNSAVHDATNNVVLGIIGAPITPRSPGPTQFCLLTNRRTG